MYITRVPNHGSKPTILLRESYWEKGKSKNRTLLNLTHSAPDDIAAMELALKHKKDLSALGSSKELVSLEEGLIVGSPWVVIQIANRLGIGKALGKTFEGQLALLQVVARVLDQGSRLSAVRLAQTHAIPEFIGLTRGLDENDLYENLKWLSSEQADIEKRFFKQRHSDNPPQLFLYDVTSSYLEGEDNALADWGYNRDGKRGKKQLVIGLLCDEEGEPVSTEVFAGNTQDIATFESQVKKTAERFGCKNITVVGDKGMIKSGGIETLAAAGFHYITAITKPQMETLLKQNIFQLSFFEENLFEVTHEGIRYVLRRNPERVLEMERKRNDKKKSLQMLLEKKNDYLTKHIRAQADKAQKEIKQKIEKLNLSRWLSVKLETRTLTLHEDLKAKGDLSRLDGCYCLKTDLPREEADKQVIHDRYKDLAEVEWAFRTMKTGQLELRPVFVRTDANTRGHVFVVMLAYLVIRALRKAWEALDITVEEGLRELSSLCSMQITFKEGGSCQQIPNPRKTSAELLEALNLSLPSLLPPRKIRIVTRHKLISRRTTP